MKGCGRCATGRRVSRSSVPTTSRLYRAVNARFADAVRRRSRSDRPLVLVQDYHFALAPRIIRERLPLSTIVAFWHIPWPNPRDYASCPWGRQLLEGLLGSTIVGFQTPEDCRNFIETVEAFARRAGQPQRATSSPTLAARRRFAPIRCRSSGRVGGHVSHRRSRPAAGGPARQLRSASRTSRLGVGVDRLDYTKGIDEKFLAVERLLELRPDVHERFVFVQIAEPSRHCLPAYRELRSRLTATADRINRRFGTDRYHPIVLLEAHHEPAEVYRFLRAADVCYVGSLHDGMNLVAKEFVSARDDERGVLILSEFAGAARELPQALIVNPYAIDACARTLGEALTMTDRGTAQSHACDAVGGRRVQRLPVGRRDVGGRGSSACGEHAELAGIVGVAAALSVVSGSDAVYNCARISHRSGKSGRPTVSFRYAAPADPPVPCLVPIVRSTIFTCR